MCLKQPQRSVTNDCQCPLKEAKSASLAGMELPRQIRNPVPLWLLSKWFSKCVALLPLIKFPQPLWCLVLARYQGSSIPRFPASASLLLLLLLLLLCNFILRFFILRFLRVVIFFSVVKQTHKRICNVTHGSAKKQAVIKMKIINEMDFTQLNTVTPQALLSRWTVLCRVAQAVCFILHLLTFFY